jgi:ELWxxDGT repeat protein
MTLAFFNGVDAAGNDGLWVTDGTARGTHEIANISGAWSGGLEPSDLTVFNHEVLFAGYDTSGLAGLWVTNGTAAGTHEITGISGAWSGGLEPSDLTVFKNEVLFYGLDAAGLKSPWVTNGTAAGIHEITGISAVLGHTDSRVTEEHYNRATTTEAAKTYAAIIRQYRIS